MLLVLEISSFLGIEILFIEIDDPFAEDANDLPLTEEARAAAEDVLLSLSHIDGSEAVAAMLMRVAPLHSPSNTKSHQFRVINDSPFSTELDPLV